ncbi:hypothetical protein BJF85_19605 [Saccharomonospora sp. CUA-673]|nr:hypothetical protein BJF85_19605 [Saccharomonospora sp. CUA-673]
MLAVGGQASAHPPGSALSLSIKTSDGTVAFTQLWCDPTGGSHPTAARACAALDDAEGDLADLEPSHQACPMIHDPVRASAHGYWDGEPVHFTTTYNNRCMADAESGGVFGF